MADSSSASERNVLDVLAEDFVARLRNGERPALSEYISEHPELGDRIRELFPALVLMERLKPESDDTSGYEPDAEPLGRDATPTQIGEYRILREIGRGGMGIVYEAEQQSLGRHVALKVLPGHGLINSTYLERFRQEAKAAARLHHTNIVPVFGVGESDGLHFYAMQFIQGEGLDQVLQDVRRLRQLQGSPPATRVLPRETHIAPSAAERLVEGRFAPPPESGIVESDTDASMASESSSISGLSTTPSESEYYRSVARLGVQVADALAYAHRQGILHRDVKPSNLLLDRQGTVWVTDFGLAKVEDADDLTGTGDIVGTIRFMAPERFDGRSLPQSDIYGLGLTLYEVLTLRPAFEDRNRARLIEKIFHDPPTRPSKIDPHLPLDLETIVSKCLAKEPSDRYSTAEELGEDLERYLADRPILARRTPWHERAWRLCRRNPVVSMLMGFVALLMLAITVLSVVYAIDSRDQLRRVERAERQQREANGKAIDRLFTAYFSQARAERGRMSAGHKLTSLEVLGLAAEIRKSLALRNEAIACSALYDVDLEPISRLPLPDIIATRAALASNYWAYIDPSGKVVVLDRHRNVEIGGFHVAPEAKPKLAEFSRDSRLLTVWMRSPSRILDVWDWAKKKRLLSIPAERVPFAAVDLSWDSRWCAIGTKSGDVALYEVATGRRTKVISLPTPGLFVRFDPTGTRLAVGFRAKMSKGYPIRIYDVARGESFVTLLAPSVALCGSWSPDGTLFASGCSNWKGYVWRVDSLERIGELAGHSAEISRVVFDHSGRVLLTHSADGTSRLWDAQACRALVTLPHTNAVAFDPDNAALWTVGHKEGRTLKYEPPKAFRTLLGHVLYKGPWGTAISPDSRFLATCGQDGIRLWHLATGEALAHLPVPSLSVMFTPDGRSLIGCGRSGVHRWTFDFDEPANTLRLEWEERLIDTKRPERAVLSRDGSTLAVIDQVTRRLIVTSMEGDDRIEAKVRKDASNLSISPDGSWVAVSNWPSFWLHVFDARTGKSVLEREYSRHCSASFSPGGRELYVGTNIEAELLEVGTWKRVRTVSEALVERGARQATFSHDGTILAVHGRTWRITLLRADTLEEVGTLEPPTPQPIHSLAFSPDGNWLAASCGTRIVQVWNLAELRGGLRRIDLDWRRSPLGKGSIDTRPAPEVSVSLADVPKDAILAFRGSPMSTIRLACAILESRGYDPEWWHILGSAYLELNRTQHAHHIFDRALRLHPDEALFHAGKGECHHRGLQYPAAIEALEAAHRLDGENPSIANHLAWLLLFAPKPGHDYPRAVALAEDAVAKGRKNGLFRVTLGLALYRVGKHADAMRVLEQTPRSAVKDKYVIYRAVQSMCASKLRKGDLSVHILEEAEAAFAKAKNLDERTKTESQRILALAALAGGRE